MNRLLFNKCFVTPAPLIRNYSIKSLAAPSFRSVVVPKTTPPLKNLIIKPIVCKLISSNGLHHPFQRSYASYAPINIDVSNLTKDVIVYKYNSPRFYKLMNVFAIVQFFFWLICSEFTLSTLRDAPVDESGPNFDEQPFYYRINLGENKYKYGIATACFLLGKQMPHQYKICEIAFDSIYLFVCFVGRLFNYRIRVGVYIAKRTLFGVAKRWTKSGHRHVWPVWY